jgi:hypothetical protein
VIAAVFEALKRARVGILLNDLARSPWGYLGYTIFTGLLLHRSFAFHDGRLSIRRGFTLREFQEILGPLSDRLVFGTAHPSRVWVATRPMLP